MTPLLNTLKASFFAEKDRLVLWLPVLFGVGIGLYFLLPFEPSVWTTIITVEALLIGLYVFRYNPNKTILISSLLIVAFGFTNIQVRSIYKSKFIEHIKNPKEVTYLKGKIIKIDTNTKGKTRLLLTDVSDFDNTKKGLYRITLSSKNDFVKEQMCVEMISTIMPPMLPVLPNTYQFNRKYFYDDLSAMGYANSNVFEIDCEAKNTLSQNISYWLRSLRKQVVANIYKELPNEEASVISAILAGDKDGISTKLYQQYRDSGLAHFLSISGLHMGIIATLTFFAIRLIISLVPTLVLRCDSKKISAIFAICMSFIYLLISGAEIPAQRAFIMTFIVLLGVLFSRNAISMRMLSFAAFIVLLISPYALIGASFQMSFAAVMVLIAFYERFASSIQNFFKGKNIIKIILAYIVGLLLSDFVASIATLPFAIYHFNTIAIYTTIGNLLAGPIIGFIIMPFVLLALFLMPFGLYLWPLKIVGFGVLLVNNITAYVSSLENAGYQIISIPFWGLMFIVFGGLWLCIWQQKWRLFGVFPLILGIISIFTVSIPDFIYNADGKNIALKDNSGNILVLPTRKNDFIKQMWLEKTASKDITIEQKNKLKNIYNGKSLDKDWIDLHCDDDKCYYKDKISWDKKGKLWIEGKERNTQEDGGGVIYLKNNKIKVKSIRSYIGNRLWN